MQHILSIDVTSDPIVGAVSEVNGRHVRIVERRSAEMGGLFRPVLAGSTEIPDPDSKESSDVNEAENPRTEVESPFRAFISSFQNSWTDATMIIPAFDTVSLTLQLPFGDTKSIERILDMEVQDLVPFDTEDFLIQHATLGPSAVGGPSGASAFDVHVDLMPVDYVGQIMAICKSADFEPRVLSSTTGILSALYFLAPEYLSPNSAVLASHGGQYHFAIAQDSDVRVVRVMSPFGDNASQHLNGNADHGAGPGTQSDRALLFSQLKLTIASAERRFGNKIEKIYVIGSDLRASEVQATCGRPVEMLELQDLIKSNGPAPELSSLASVFVQDEDPPALLTNFRTRQFAYSPQLKELIFGLKQLTPYLAGLLITVVVSLVGIYSIREYRISSIRQVMVEQVRKVVPNLELDSGDEMRSIQLQLGKLGQQLKAIGSSSSLSPLDAFFVLSESIPKVTDIDFKKLEIKGETIQLEGSGPSYTAVEQLTSALKQKPEFSSVDSNFRKSSGEQVSFTYTISFTEN